MFSKGWKTEHKRFASKGRKGFGVRKIGTLRRERRDRHFFKKLIIFGFIAGIMGIIALVSLFYYYARDLPSVAQIASGGMVIPESTKIYDRTGKNLLYSIHGEENRTRIALGEIPPYVKEATIATEDQDFYTRDLAVDFKGIARAFFGILRSGSFTEGPGGSTITQQLIKNLILTRERTVERKVKEIILAFRIEKFFTRDEILELYLNQIPYGSNAYGIEEAAQTFFGKGASQLTLGEAALLAALPKATTYYSPHGAHKDELFERQKVILRQMLNEGYITEEEFGASQDEKLVFKSNITNIEAPHFVIYVREILAKKYGEEELEAGGLKVITTLDYDLQQLAERVVKEGAKKNDAYRANNAAFVAIDPENGQILALVGSRDYFDEEHDGNFNAALSPQQPGSSFKPIVYATLFEKGYTPNTVLYDVVTDFVPGEKEYIPKNFNLKEYGPVTIRKALGGSLNIPAVKALYLVGIETVADYAQKLGYSTFDNIENVGLSMALGSMDVKLLEHVLAFATLANDGVHHDAVSILKVTNPQGTVVEEYKESEGARIFSANSVRMVTSVLTDNDARAFIFGAQSSLTIPGFQVAAKTGTTNESRDAWTVGYTPTLAAGVWVGNNNNTPMNDGAGGVRAAGPIWRNFMKEALKGKKAREFPKPNIPVTGKQVLDGAVPVTTKVKIDTASGKLASAYTPLEFIKEEEFPEFHSILHYIDKDNPLGPPPKDPSSDPQYKNWEDAIAAWVEKSDQFKNYKKPPQESDDVHDPKFAPNLTILAPGEGAAVLEGQLFVDILAVAQKGISRVEYYLDNVLRESAGIAPFSRILTFGSIADGAHVITVKAYDIVGNRAEKQVTITLVRGITKGSAPHEAEPKISITVPSNKDVVLSQNFPIAIQVKIENPVLVRDIAVYYDDSQKNPVLISQQSSGFDREMKFYWRTPPYPGSYPLYIVAFDLQGRSYRDEVSVTIN